jgi:hypothetical protein
MWTVSGAVDGLNIAPTGSASTICPFTMRKPRGVFIQPLAATTKNAPAIPEMIIGTADSMCARGDIRSHPYR